MGGWDSGGSPLPRLFRAECWIALIDLMGEHEVTAGDGWGGMRCIREVKCAALPRLDQLVGTDDSDGTYKQTQKASAREQEECEFPIRI